MPKTSKPKNDLTAATVNAEIIAARFGEYSPILDGEDEQDFANFQMSCIHAIQPANAIEEVWVMDFINYTWEALRLRRMKVALIHSNRQKAVQDLLESHSPGFNPTITATAEAWAKGNKKSVKHVDEFLKSHGLDDGAIVANALQLCIQNFERLDKLIASYDFRRDKAIRELEQRRELLSRRARELAENVQDAEYVDLSGGSNQ